MRLLNFFKQLISKIIIGKIGINIFILLSFAVLLNSCKTCKCPAYSQNEVQTEECSNKV